MKKLQNKKFWIAIGHRFFRTFVAGAITSVTLISINDVTTWTDLGTAISGLCVAMIIGGINGVLMAIDKAYRFK